MAIRIGEDGTIINDDQVISSSGTIIRDDGTIESSNIVMQFCATKKLCVSCCACFSA